MMHSNAQSQELPEEDDEELSPSQGPRVSGTRKVVPRATIDDDASVERSERPTIRVPRFELLSARATEPNVLVIGEAAPADRSDADAAHPDGVPTVPAPPLTARTDPASVHERPTRGPPSFRALGSLERVPRLACTPAEILQASLDPKQAFVLVLVDGYLDIETILDATPLPLHDVLRILLQLLERGLIAFDVADDAIEPR